MADLVVERIDGWPYLSINIDRLKIARHGANLSDALRLRGRAVDINDPSDGHAGGALPLVGTQSGKQ
jgi:hypothetical protein